MTYDQLVAFVAVVESGTFRSAAAQLHKSQPAVSKLVSNLEAGLSLQLFDRDHYRAHLTDSGRLFFERAQTVLESTDALRSYGAALSSQPEPVVRLGIEAVAPLERILRALSEVQRRFPATRVELTTERLSGAMDALEGGEAHLVVATTYGMDTNVMEAHPFATVRIRAVVRTDHPLAREDAPVSAHLLREHAQVVLRDSARSELSPSLNVLSGGLRWSVTDVAAKKEIIAVGMGWGGLPEHIVAEEIARGDLCVLDVREFDADAMELYVVRRRDRPRGIVAEALWDGLGRAPK